ncbi:hypothetical protein SAMN05660691_02426 [Rheinheimera pacifica]|uniref:Uncharacterized protein n=1 Tax=Rheinheimera pacifica TaxID=173990 RepID=A0A1H6M389_9GAMM|nr:hypothetical protein [Rheinheimera pacifica]SEH95666.1 hypothetical protein SAMN05660691_02426 [Rheinheimera pacifica]
MSVDQQAREILNELREKLSAGNDGSIYGDKSRALKDIDSLLSSPSTEGVKYLLLPTSNLQELSLENGWGKEFYLLANQLENLLGIS